MKRKEFLRSLTVIGAGFSMFSCGKDVIDGIVGENEMGSISLAEAKKYVLNEYLPKFEGLREQAKNGKSCKRKVNLDKAKKKKDEKNREFIWVPVEYEDEIRPGALIVEENAPWKKDLAQYLTQPVIEGMVVTKVKNKTEAYLVQLAYNQNKVRENGKRLDLTQLDGLIIKADWDDNPSEIITFRNGRKLEAYAPEGQNLRTSGCYVVEYISQRVEVFVNPDGTYRWIVYLHKSYRFSCTNGAAPGTSVGAGVSTNGGPYYGGTGGIMDGTETSTETYLRPNYQIGPALSSNGSQRALLNGRLSDFLSATGTAVSILDWSLQKAEALANVVGAPLKTYFPEAVIFGKRVGLVGVLLDGREVFIAYSDAGLNWNNMSTWDQTKAIIWGVGATAFVFEFFWLGAAAATVSIGMGVAKELL